MAQIVDTPIEFRCPVCGKIQVVMSGGGIIPPVIIDPLFRRDGEDYCQCGKKQAKK